MAFLTLSYLIWFVTIPSSAIENCYVKNIIAQLKPQSEVWIQSNTTLPGCAVKCSVSVDCVSFRYVHFGRMCYAYDYRVRSTSGSSKKSTFRVTCKDEGYFLETGAHIYFKFHREEANWTAAQEVCRVEGAGLIVLDTDQKHRFIAAKMRSLTSGPFRIWTALRRGETRKYMWPNGKENVFRWNKGDPSFINEHCCFLKPTGLADAHCFDAHQFICGKETRYFEL